MFPEAVTFQVREVHKKKKRGNFGFPCFIFFSGSDALKNKLILMIYLLWIALMEVLFLKAFPIPTKKGRNTSSL
jgi:hypothetical protein